MAAFAYQVEAAAEPAIYLSDTSSSPIHHHHAGAQNYQIAPGFTTGLPSPTSSCFPFLSYSSYPVPYYDPVRAQESRGSSMDDDDDIISPPLSTQQAPAQASLSQSSSQESVDVEKKRKQGKLQGAADEACDHRANKQRKCGGGRNKGNANKGSSAARRNAGGGRREQKNAAETPREPPPEGYIHVRARRGQATDSHSLAERVRREKISARMKLLQELVPGCDKVTGKALMLDEIINYVQSLQHQVEFLSMKLASLSPVLYDFGPDLDHYMAQLQKVERLSPSSPVQHTQAGNHIVIQTSSATTAGFTKTTNVYNAEHTRTGDSSVVPYLMQGCHTGLPTTTPASTYSLQQGNGSSSLLQVVGGDNNTHPFLNQLQFATNNNNNNLCSFQ